MILLLINDIIFSYYFDELVIVHIKKIIGIEIIIHIAKETVDEVSFLMYSKSRKLKKKISE